MTFRITMVSGKVWYIDYAQNPRPGQPSGPGREGVAVEHLLSRPSLFVYSREIHGDKEWINTSNIESIKATT